MEFQECRPRCLLLEKKGNLVAKENQGNHPQAQKVKKVLKETQV